MAAVMGQQPQNMFGGPGMGMGQKAGFGAAAGLGGMLGPLFGGGGLFGKEGGAQQFQNYTPGQNQMMDLLMSMGMQNMDPQAQNQQAMQNFRQNTVPGLAERFSMMGSGGGQRSSAFAGALGQAGADIEPRLAALRNQMGMGQMQMGLQPRFENMYMPAQKGGLEGGLESLMKMLPFLMMM